MDGGLSAGSDHRRVGRQPGVRHPIVDPTYTYTYPPGPAPVGAPELDRLAITAMVLGLVGLLVGFLYAIPCLLAIIAGAVALRRIQFSNGWRLGQGMAVIGLATGIFGTVAWGVVILLVRAA